jgi:hypothetical protein
MNNVTADQFGRIPEGMKWCPHCNGYGSSLKEESGRCTHCGGSGLVWADRDRRSRAATASRPHGTSERPAGDATAGLSPTTGAAGCPRVQTGAGPEPGPAGERSPDAGRASVHV